MIDRQRESSESVKERLQDLVIISCPTTHIHVRAHVHYCFMLEPGIHIKEEINDISVSYLMKLI